MARDTAWPALSTHTPASAVLVDGLPGHQHASQRLTRANDRGRRLSSEASLVPAAVMRGDALCAPCIGTWARRKTASATRGMMRRWAARCPTSAPWEASGPPSHIHLSVLPHNDRGTHSPRDAGVLGRGALVHARRWSIRICNGLCHRPLLPLGPARGGCGSRGPACAQAGALSRACGTFLTRLHVSLLLVPG
jgi:hypothetical protein